MNCCVVPFGTEALAGEIVMETRPAAETVSIAVPVIVPDPAVTVALPTAVPVARPFKIVAAVLTVQVTELVRSWVDPSLYVPRAVNCCVFPFWTVTLAGDTAMDTSAAGRTVMFAVEDIPLNEAVMTGSPVNWAVAMPDGLMVAPAEVLHVARLVRSLLDPSVYVPCAVNCCVLPAGTETAAGDTRIESRAAGATVRVAALLVEPDAALITAEP